MASAKTLKLFAFLLSAIMVLSLAACAGNAETTPSDSGNSAPSSGQPSNESSKPQETENDLPESSEAPGDTASEETDGSTSSDSKILVAYFSHTGENYNVGVIEKGNTHIIADMIAEETGAYGCRRENTKVFETDYKNNKGEKRHEQDISSIFFCKRNNSGSRKKACQRSRGRSV